MLEKSTALARTIAIFLLLCIPSLSLYAYDYNKVITRTFDWRIKSTLHFDIYYYDASGEKLLPVLEKQLEAAYDKVTRLLPAHPAERIPFFFYNTHNEFEQTNITDISEGVGGVTEAYKNRFILSNSGSARELEYLITHEFTHEIEFEYLFSGFWRSVRLLKFIFYPNWVMEGLAEYSVRDVDPSQNEMYLRDAATCGKLLRLGHLHSFDHVLPHQVRLAYKESGAFMVYLAGEYGEEKLPKLLESYRNNFDPDTVLREVTGTDLSVLDKRFREYMEEKYAALSKGLKEPEEYGKPIAKNGIYPRFEGNGVFSPDGNNIYYISDARGSREIYEHNLNSGKKKRIYGITQGSDIEYISDSGSGLSISADGGFLAFIGEEQQKDYIYIRDLKTGRVNKYWPGTDTMYAPALSPDSGTVYFSGLRGGHRDLYSYNIKTGALSQMTNGPDDEIDAAISPDGRTLAYSVEKKNASGRYEYNLEALDIASGRVSQLTDLAGDERNPAYSPDGARIYFVSDQDGINDIYSMDAAGGRVERLTKVIGGNFQPAPSPDGKKLLFTSFRRGEMRLYMMDLDAARENIPEGVKTGGEGSEEESFVSLSSTSPLRNYRFRPGLDLFYPALFYSSIDGLYLATYMQASEMLGDHQMSSYVTYGSGSEYIDYNVAYGFLRFRPQFYFQFIGNEYFWDIDKKIKKKEDTQAMYTIYPLNRFKRVELSLSTTAKSERDSDIPDYVARSRENVAGLAFQWDVTQRGYLELTSGWGFRVDSEFSDKSMESDYTYQNYMLETWKYFPIGGEQAIGWRTLTATSLDINSGWYYLGGANRVRGYPSNLNYAGHRLFVNNIEWRFPISRNLNYHMWYFFPDFFFKTFYGSIFVDTGFAWDRDEELINIDPEQVRGSYGFSLRFYTFILQAYPFLLNLQLARRMDGPAAVVYLSLGSNF
ncbi:MAG: hypothetical protein ABII64_00315 [Elusimicrobiota bacterium]